MSEKEEEILAMKSGNQLNAEVAGQIMGVEVEYPFGKGFPYYFRDGKWDAVSQFSTGILDAWRVVDKLNRYYGVMLTVFDPSQLGYPAKKVLCEVCDSHSLTASTVFAKAYGDTAPEAICKAALLTALRGGRL